MMKSRAAACTMCLLLFLAGCGTEQEMTPTSYESLNTLETVTLTLTSAECGTFLLSNSADAPVFYGDVNTLELRRGDEWYALAGEAGGEPEYELAARDNLDYQDSRMDWSGLKGGEYRYIMPFTMDGEEGRIQYVAVAEFSI